jgi:hypothetical protein
MSDAIDAAWEERILPVLSDYTRIPCLSPAFDPDWAERGAIAAAAELLRDWVRDQDRTLTSRSVRATCSTGEAPPTTGTQRSPP